MGGVDRRGRRGRHSDARPAHGGGAHDDRAGVVADPAGPRRAAILDGTDPGRHARTDRASGRWSGLRLLGDEYRRESHRVSPGRRAAAGSQPGRGLHSGGADLPTCCSIRVASTTTTASATPTRTPGSCGGPAAIRSTTTRISIGCSSRGGSPRRSSSTRRGGTRWPGTPTSCCRARRRWSATTSRGGSSTHICSRAAAWWSPTARLATTSRSSAGSPASSAWSRSTPKIAMPTGGCATSTT